MKYPRINCNYCGRRVIDTDAGKWSHVWKYHANVPIGRLMGLFLNPTVLEQFGEIIGKRVIRALKG